MSREALPRILGQLHGVKQNKPDSYLCCCPAHKGGKEDNQSFGVTLYSDGKILMQCFSGCSFDELMDALPGVSKADLMPDDGVPPRVREEKPFDPQWETKCKEWHEEWKGSSNARKLLADALSLPQSVFEQFDLIGIDRHNRKGHCWTFPERDEYGCIIGAGLRFVTKLEDGRTKDNPSGSQRGLSIPLGWKEREGPVYIVEGPSDTLAMTAANLSCIGKPGLNQKVELVANFLSVEVPAARRIIWIVENDKEVKERNNSHAAAQKLANMLDRHIETASPPGPLDKDMRAWMTGLFLDGCQWEEMRDRLEKRLKTKVVEPKKPKPKKKDAEEDQRVQIKLDTNNEKAINDKVIGTISDDPALFVRADDIVVITCTEVYEQRGCQFPPSPQIKPVTAATLRECISARVNFLDYKDNEKHPPEWCVNAVKDRKSWPAMRYLEAVVEYPVLRPDGSLVIEPGYDERTGVFYNPIGERPVLPDVFNRDAALAAWDILNDMVCNFPFAAEIHKSAWLAALLTPLVRFAFRGAAPLFLVDGNTPGAGKGLLCDTISIPLTGHEFPTTSYSQEDEEMRKKVTTLAVRGSRLVLLDNISGMFGGSSMDQVLTSIIWEDRLLGGNNSVQIPMRATWFGTGNNVQVMGDMLRRICHIRLETPHEKPEQRSGFKRPRLRRWMKSERRKILAAALTILAAFFRAGCPQPKKYEEWGGYEEWGEIVRSAVVWIGLPDPGETRKEVRECADAQVSAMQAIIEDWNQIDPNLTGTTANKIIASVTKYVEEGEEDPLADIREAISQLTGRMVGNQLGNCFKKFRKRTFGDFYLDQATKSGHVVRWGLFKADAKSPTRITKKEFETFHKKLTEARAVESAAAPAVSGGTPEGGTDDGEAGEASEPLPSAWVKNGKA